MICITFIKFLTLYFSLKISSKQIPKVSFEQRVSFTNLYLSKIKVDWNNQTEFEDKQEETLLNKTQCK